MLRRLPSNVSCSFFSVVPVLLDLATRFVGTQPRTRIRAEPSTVAPPIEADATWSALLGMKRDIRRPPAGAGFGLILDRHRLPRADSTA